MKKIKLCKNCSNLDVNEVKELAAQNTNCKLRIGCIGQCRRKHPEFEAKYVGKIDHEVYVCNSKDEFFELIK